MQGFSDTDYTDSAIEGENAQPAGLPLLMLDSGNPAEFDYYSAFLQDQQDFNYLAEDSSASGRTSPPRSTSPLAPAVANTSLSGWGHEQRHLAPPIALAARPCDDAVHGGAGTSTRSQAQSKQRLERRGHTKSRRGCFNCKRRRIKCQETRPACGHCVKQGLRCEYPSLPSVTHQPQHQIPLFSLQDMRFFQHFLLQVYPHHPIGSEELWLHDIPCLSQQYEYLMHAILGYSASTLISPAEPGLAEAAMAHRVRAIAAIKRSLAAAAGEPDPADNCGNNNNDSSSSSAKNSKNNKNSSNSANSSRYSICEEGNALLATCFALTYQSVFLDDGLAEYMTFIRGIVIVALQMYRRGTRPLFAPFMEGMREREALEPHMADLPLLDAGWVDRAVAGVEGLGALVEGDGWEVERRSWELMGEWVGTLRVSSWKGYVAMTQHYAWWMMLAHEQFERLIDPSNQVAILLASHFIALQQIMTRICEAEELAAAKLPQRSSSQGDIGPGNSRWLKYLNRQLDVKYAGYNEFPIWVEAQLDRDLTFFGKTR